MSAAEGVVVAQLHPDGTVERWDADAGTYELLAVDGTPMEARSLTASELVWLAANPSTDPAKRAWLNRQVRLARKANRDFLDLPPPAVPLLPAGEQQIVDQVIALTRQMNALIGLVVGRDLLV